MGYDLFKDLKIRYNIAFTPIYKELFKKIKFDRDTITPNPNLIKLKQSDVISIDAKNVFDYGYNIVVSFQISRNIVGDNVVTKIFFVNNYKYFVVSNIHVIEQGLMFHYDCYDTDSWKKVSMAQNSFIPKPEDFNELNIKPTYSDEGIILKEHSTTDVIHYVVDHYFMCYEFEQVHEMLKVRS